MTGHYPESQKYLKQNDVTPRMWHGLSRICYGTTSELRTLQLTSWRKKEAKIYS